jgi:cell shape-determining protein MreC
MAKILISLSLLFLTLSAVFGVLNTNKTRELREAAEHRAAMPQPRPAAPSATKPAQPQNASAEAKTAEVENKIASAEAELVKTQSEKADLQAKLQAKQKELADAQKRLEDTGSKEEMPETLPMPGAGDLQAQLEETRRQLDTAEREKQVLSARIRTTDDRSVRTEAPRKRVQTISRNPGIRGTVLAVNQAYNFVVLNMGGRQGVEANSDMLVLRRGVLIGKIRVSSVEPATAIGDIMTNSLARGVQVQPGDVVIYAGSNP